VSFSFVNCLIVERVEVDAVDDGHAHGFVISEKKIKLTFMQIFKKSEYLGNVNNYTMYFTSEQKFYTVG